MDELAMNTATHRLVLTPDYARLLLHRHGSFLFYAELNHKKKMQAARRERRQLHAELKAVGILPARVLLNEELMNQESVNQ